MATSSIKIYKCELTPERNAKVDQLADYLADLTAIYENDKFQYQKIDLDIVIKIEVDQSYVGTAVGNYLDLYQDNKHFYYFIMKPTWRSANTVELQCSIDSVNTFATDFTFTNKTNIIRQHKDRFYASATFTPGSSYSITKIVDKVSEGINGVKYQYSDNTIASTIDTKSSMWYLVYKNNADVNDEKYPLECLLVPGTSVPTASGYVSSKVINSAFFDDLSMQYIYILKSDNPNFYAGSSYNWTDWPLYVGFKIEKDSSNIRITPIADGITQPSPISTSSITVTNMVGYRLTNIDTYQVSEVENEAFVYLRVGAMNDGVNYSININDVNKTDSKIVKIIECPYCPIGITWTGNSINLPAGWQYAGGCFKLTNLNNEFLNDKFNADLLSSQYSLTFSGAQTVTKAAFTRLGKSQSYEPKLLHSDFYNYNLVYDSFTSPVNFEQISILNNTTPQIKVEYKQSNTLSSDLAFKWSIVGQTYNEQGNYDHYLLSNRNNEIGLYTSEYLNYMRVGYNYDRKQANMSIAGSWLGTGAAIAGAIASFALAGATGGISAVAAVSLATTAVGGIANSISTTVTQERNLAQKINETQNSAVQVSNMNDVNLLHYYNGNKLHKTIYEISADLKVSVFDLFHRCGYALNKPGIPDTTSRYWFNYIQCEPVFAANSNAYDNFKQDLIARYKAGVTVYHNNGGTYDWQQQYWNPETSMF